MDIKTINIDMGFDWSILEGGLLTDDSLETAIVVSLFTDRRAEDGDEFGHDPRGWWGDSLADDPHDRIGSRLWLVRRAKIQKEAIEDAKHYATEALAWLVEDGVATAVSVDAECLPPDILALQIDIAQPSGPSRSFKYVLKGALNAV